jgi:hypothetical protein
MTLFIAFLWWMVAVVIIVRWFHVCSVDINVEEEDLRIAKNGEEAGEVHDQLASRA